ncbi:hypothetical protein, partial [Streptomyces sp. NPDC047123]|uniref:hypothetical protein n=1 Tax=Streptomyces sp. NPDC047123 TaxID=3155622 RepID=UPI0033C41A06
PRPRPPLPAAPGPAAPPSRTHGPHARPRRTAPAAPAIGVATGSAAVQAAGSSAAWPAPAPAGERRRP